MGCWFSSGTRHIVVSAHGVTRRTCTLLRRRERSLSLDTRRGQSLVNTAQRSHTCECCRRYLLHCMRKWSKSGRISFDFFLSPSLSISASWILRLCVCHYSPLVSFIHHPWFVHPTLALFHPPPMRFAILYSVYLIFRIACFHVVQSIHYTCAWTTRAWFTLQTSFTIVLLLMFHCCVFIVLSILQLCAHGNNFTPKIFARTLAFSRSICRVPQVRGTMHNGHIGLCQDTLKAIHCVCFLNFEGQRLVEVRLPTMFLQYEPSSLSRLWLNVDGPLNECQVCMHKEKCQQWNVKSGGRWTSESVPCFAMLSSIGWSSYMELNVECTATANCIIETTPVTWGQGNMQWLESCGTPSILDVLLDHCW